MRYFKSLLLTAFTLLLFLSAAAQNISGVVKVMKPNGRVEPIAFASIYWVEQQRVLESNQNGEFSFDSLGEKKLTLIATFVGHTQDTVVLSANDSNADFLIREGAELEAAKVLTRQEANYISKLTPVKREVISAAGLCKMACCNLAESFENSASITVGYADAITGARQIRLLGLSGIYTQMLDENRPIMRGIAAPFGLSYVPGQWLESIQIAKGPSSVINGLEAISGQINLEHRKPTTEQPLFLNLFLSSKLRSEANIASSIQLNDKWSSVILGHFSKDPGGHDGNNDGFMDEPNATQFNLSNRWLYMANNGAQVRFGFKALSDDRVAGELDFNRNRDRDESVWGSNIKNSGLNSYLKVGIPLNTENTKNIATVVDYSYHKLDSYFGLKEYDATQHSLFANLIFQNVVNENHQYTLGASFVADDIEEHLRDYHLGSFSNLSPGREEEAVGAYGEYTYTQDEKISIVAGMRLDYNTIHGWLPAPRLNIKYAFDDNFIFRALAGRGFRSANILSDNLGILSTGRKIEGWENLDIEDAWTYGTSVTAYFPLGFEEATLSFDYFRTDFNRQVIVDQELDLSKISIYNLDGKSYTNTYQVDFSMEPIERLTLLTTFRYSDAKITLQGQGLVEKPLTSRYKGVFNIQYATRMNKWVFDFTAQVNGPARLPDFAGMGEKSPVYGMLYGQITKKLRDLEIYVGVENLTNYKQKHAIIDAATPYSENFNASVVWGPLMGRKFYTGLRFTLWK